MIRRTIFLLLLSIMVGGVAHVYAGKQLAGRTAAREALLEEKIAEGREAIAILRTEWSMLTQPGELQSIVERHKEELGLEYIAASQVRQGFDFVDESQRLAADVAAQERALRGRQ